MHLSLLRLLALHMSSLGGAGTTGLRPEYRHTSDTADVLFGAMVVRVAISRPEGGSEQQVRGTEEWQQSVGGKATARAAVNQRGCQIFLRSTKTECTFNDTSGSHGMRGSMECKGEG